MLPTPLCGIFKETFYVLNSYAVILYDKSYNEMEKGADTRKMSPKFLRIVDCVRLFTLFLVA